LEHQANHSEISAYIGCADTDAIVGQIVALCEGEGMVRVAADPPAAPTDEQGWTIAVVPAAPGWHLLLSLPAPWLSERGRFSALCHALGAPGLLIDFCYLEGEQTGWAVMLETDGKGGKLLSGHSNDVVDTHLEWHGQVMDPALWDVNGARLIEALLPQQWVRDELALSEHEPARQCGTYAQRLAGEAGKWWVAQGGWIFLQRAMQLGGPLNLPGAVLLRFASGKPGMRPTVPKGYFPLDLPLLTHVNREGQHFHVGDIVELADGRRGRIASFFDGDAFVDTLDGESASDEAQALRFVARPFSARECGPVAALAAAAGAGDADAQAELGVRHALGLGVPHNYHAAAYWWRLAALQGHADAQCHLGQALLEGHGRPPAPNAARAWLHKAATQGQLQAQYFLGQAYARDATLPNCAVQARRWLLGAAEGGIVHAGFQLAQLLARAGDPAQALHWYRQCAAQGMSAADVRLGACYQDGAGVGKDAALAVQLFRRAAMRGNSEAQYRLGLCCRAGRGVAPDPAQAISWFRKASAQHHPGAYDAMRDTSSNGRLADLQAGELDVATIAALNEPPPGWVANDALVRTFLGLPTLWREGKVVWAHIIQANSALFEPGTDGAPAEVVYDTTGRAGPDQLHEVAEQLYAMRHASEPFADQAMQDYADCLNDEMMRTFGLPVFDQVAHPGWLASTIFIERSYLPTGYLEHSAFPILISEKCFGVVMPLPQRWWPDGLVEKWLSVGKFSHYNPNCVTLAHMNDQRADDGFERRARLGDARDQYQAGARLAGGDGVAPDAARAGAWYRAAADQGHAPAQVAYGLMLQHGRGVARDLPGAVRWIGMAADAGDGMALAILGQMHQHGIGMPASPAMATRFYYQASMQLGRDAADGGKWPAQFDLAFMYLEGKGLDRDLEEGRRLLHQAAMHGYDEAQYSMGALYVNGNGVEVDLETAYFWLLLAKAQGHKKAEAVSQQAREWLNARQRETTERAAARWKPAGEDA
jgi:TPR repeat protein